MEKNNLIQVLQDWELLLSEISRNGTALDNNALYVLNETIRAALAPVDVDAIHQDGFDEGFESGKLEATEFDRDLRRAVFGFLEKRGQIENGEEYTAQDIMDCLVAYEHYLINTNKAPKPVDVDAGLRALDYQRDLALIFMVAKGSKDYDETIGDRIERVQELILQLKKQNDHLAARGCFVPEGYALVPIEPTDEILNAMAEQCDGYNENYYFDIYKAMIKAAPKKEGV